MFPGGNETPRRLWPAAPRGCAATAGRSGQAPVLATTTRSGPGFRRSAPPRECRQPGRLAADVAVRGLYSAPRACGAGARVTSATPGPPGARPGENAHPGGSPEEQASILPLVQMRVDLGGRASTDRSASRCRHWQPAHHRTAAIAAEGRAVVGHQRQRDPAQLDRLPRTSRIATPPCSEHARMPAVPRYGVDVRRRAVADADLKGPFYLRPEAGPVAPALEARRRPQLVGHCCASERGPGHGGVSSLASRARPASCVGIPLAR